MSRLAENIDRVKARIAAVARAPVTLVAVSKTRSAEEIRAACELGLHHFGENYVREATAKIPTLADLEICWHFIGQLQSNKTREVATYFDWVQTLDRLKIAERLSDQRPQHLPPLQVCIQVNIDDEASKAGVAPAETAALVAAVTLLPRLQVRGLMAIPAPHRDPASQGQACLRMAALFAEIRKQHSDLDTLSLGMSADLEAAVTAGSTMVRIGTDIFGPRN